MGAPLSVTANFVSADIDGNGSLTVADVQAIINEALGISPPANDLNNDGVVNITDAAKGISAVMGHLY
jgi:hypothetical protein